LEQKTQTHIDKVSFALKQVVQTHPTFSRWSNNDVVPGSGAMSAEAGLNPEDEDSTIIRNVGIYQRVHTMPKP
jgi:squalene cyclase